MTVHLTTADVEQIHRLRELLVAKYTGANQQLADQYAAMSDGAIVRHALAEEFKRQERWVVINPGFEVLEAKRKLLVFQIREQLKSLHAATNGLNDPHYFASDDPAGELAEPLSSMDGE